jgi:hypothetical protein
MFFKRHDNGMSDSEKFEAHGRAYARLKDMKSSAATAKAILLEYSERLDSTNKLVKQFINDPLYKSSSYIQLSDHLKGEIGRLSVAELANQVDELVYTTKQLIELQAQIDSF